MTRRRTPRPATIIVDGAGAFVALPDHPIISREAALASPYATEVEPGLWKFVGTAGGQPIMATYTVRRESADGDTLELTRRY